MSKFYYLTQEKKAINIDNIMFIAQRSGKDNSGNKIYAIDFTMKSDCYLTVWYSTKELRDSEFEKILNT